jgi:hypothetical protein
MKTMLKALIDVIQLESGLGSPILEDTHLLDYLEWGWLLKVREFLHHIQGKILEDTRLIDYLEWGWLPKVREFLHHIQGKILRVNKRPGTFQEGDQFIMEAPILQTRTYKECMLIHCCCLYLKVELLSDITGVNGKQILREWKTDTTDKPSTSLKKWPRQKNPGKEAWKIWQKFLHEAFKNNNGALQRPLGTWLTQNKHRRHSAYFDYMSKSMFCYEDQLWRKFQRTTKTRRQMIF